MGADLERAEKLDRILEHAKNEFIQIREEAGKRLVDEQERLAYFRKRKLINAVSDCGNGFLIGSMVVSAFLFGLFLGAKL
jgi:hypothetical protein